MQINIHVTPRFERALLRLMRARGLKNKSEAIRLAVEEAADRANAGARTDFATWRGAGLAAPTSERPRFTSDDDLWK